MPEEVAENLPLRDKEFTKEEIIALEKKTWIEIKDLIFETEPSILDYLSFHCKRWRQSQANNLLESSKAKIKSLKSKTSLPVQAQNNQRSTSVPV